MRVIENEKTRKALRIGVPIVLTASAVLCALFATDGRKYVVITVIVALLTLLLFAAGFDRRRIGSRRLILGAVFTALSVTGRFIPLLKPMSAMIIIAGLYAGPETGFLVGSTSALISNFWFGNGPWTPMQMVALGLTGFFAGVFSPLLEKSRAALIAYGALSGIFYSMFMDIWTVTSSAGTLDLHEYLTALYYALFFMISYAASNALYLFLLAPPFGRKLRRIKDKYGL